MLLDSPSTRSLSHSHSVNHHQTPLSELMLITSTPLLLSLSTHRIFSSAHGAGEAIRGTFNDSIDQVGEGIAGAGSSEKEKAERQANLATKDSGNEDSGKVVNKGVQEVKDGLNQIGSTTK